ncbi:MarR family winged helix-turn-helix transcriptional regulator [Shimia ponticola]|uniref:MarR family winged helix-turn-helix transcriptional regulator n=1 Tax=Shimia ponticola TaxID=2582893 RepID=UPI0011BD4B36|nr:MarR family transcriptional regulator [Shimia ponticola]
MTRTSNPPLGRLLKDAFDTYHARIIDDLAQAGFSDVTRAQGLVLAMMGSEPVRAVDLAEKLGVSKQALSVTAKELIHKGYLADAADPNDGRARKLTLSEKGIAMKAAGETARRQFETNLHLDLGSATYDSLIQSLRKIADQL